jgi:hypothetical protein
VGRSCEHAYSSSIKFGYTSPAERLPASQEGPSSMELNILRSEVLREVNVIAAFLFACYNFTCGGSVSLLIAGKLPPDYAASYLKRLYSWRVNQSRAFGQGQLSLSVARSAVRT